MFFLARFLLSLSAHLPPLPSFSIPVCLAISFKSVTFDVKWSRPERLQPLTHKNTHAHGGLDVEGKVRSSLQGPNHPLSLSGLLTQSHLIECVSACACEKCDHGCDFNGACRRARQRWSLGGDWCVKVCLSENVHSWLVNIRLADDRFGSGDTHTYEPACRHTRSPLARTCGVISSLIRGTVGL